MIKENFTKRINLYDFGVSPSGKATDSDSVIRRFESFQRRLSFVDRIKVSREP